MIDKPMRPKEDEVGDYICPNCKVKIDIFHMGDNYCGNCGQQLDWTKEKTAINENDFFDEITAYIQGFDEIIK